MALKPPTSGWHNARGASLCYTALMDIAERNRLRAEAHLPLLDVAIETRRLQAAQAEAEFERYFNSRRAEFAHLWSDRNRGFWTKMAIYNRIRQQLRQEMRDHYGSPGSGQ
jgi:hypothetical protein